MARIDFEQLAEMSDVDIQDAGIVPVVRLPDATEQFIARHGPASPSHQQSHDLTTDGTKLVKDAVDLEPPRSCIQGHACCLHNVGRKSHQGRVDRLNQLVHRKRSG